MSLRVVARVARVLTFDTHGKPTTTKVEDSWVIRSNSYQMRVAPVPENPEIILIRPDPTDLVLPAGRYALVLKGVAYDFSLDGPATDSAHCLERTDALNSPVYSSAKSSSRIIALIWTGWLEFVCWRFILRHMTLVRGVQERDRAKYADTVRAV